MVSAEKVTFCVQFEGGIAHDQDEKVGVTNGHRTASCASQAYLPA
jgi:hypothetical protein